MARRLATAALAALTLLVPVHAASAQTTQLWPGVTFERTIQITPNGPVAIDILTGPRPGGATTLQPILTSGLLTQRQTLTAAERQLSSTATYAGVNGDYFNFKTGLPSGVLVQDGQVLSPPNSQRSSAGIMSDGTLDVRRVSLFGSWQGTGAAHPLGGFNQLPAANGVALFTPAWGTATPRLPGSISAVLFPFPPATPGLPLQAPVQQLAADPSVAIPPGGAVLVAQGTAAAQLQTEAPVGTPVTAQLTLNPVWPGVVAAIGGGPEIVRNGAPVFRDGEQFITSQLAPRDPRTAVGQLQDGRIVLVTVDGRQPGWSVGLTNFELAQTLVRLGAVSGFALDSGGSTTMAFDGTLLNRPSGGRERPISTALAFAYSGVFVAAPVPVVSPNGDGVDDTQSLSYKLVRPSSVSVTLTAPDGSTALSQTLDAQQPGVYPVPFPPPPAAGGAALAPADGRWKLSVSATDDLGQQTSMGQSFSVNDTLGFLQTSVPRLFLPPGGRDLTISWRMGRPARVVVTVEAKDGTVVRTLLIGRLGTGDSSVVWNGLDRSRTRVKGGVYRAHVVARNGLGAVELVRTFTVRRIVGPARAP